MTTRMPTVTRKSAVAWCGMMLLGAGFWASPQLWSQRPEGPGAEGPPPGPPGGEFPGGPPGGFRFPLDPVTAALDKNGDRELSAEELSNAAEVLKELDKNKDGKLTADEVAPPFPFGGPGGGRGFGPMGGPTRKILKDYDRDGNGYLTKEERAEARKKLPAEGGGRGFGPPGGGPGGFGRSSEPPKPGPKIAPAKVKSYPDAGLYDTNVVRTLFFTFENDDWEKELESFHNTDVEVPATLVVDGNEYPNVGIHFRGMSSYMGVGTGFKRSMNVQIDLADPDQKLYGYKTLNLLNSNGDPTMLSSVLYSHIARDYIPAPKANLVKVVINGEYWGVYANVQQFNKDFLKDNYPSSKGARWKVSGSPGADGGLRYLGEDLAEYKNRFEIKTKDDDASWKALVNFCKVLDQTPPEQLEEALAPILDIDGALRFLALDCALVNSDGYWTRASDYSLFLDENGQFHTVPHDMNEAFQSGGPPGFGPPGGGGPRGGRGGERGNGGPPREGNEPFDGGRPPREGEPPRPEGGPPNEGGPGFGPPPGGGFGGFGPPGGFGGGRGPGGPGGMMHGGVDLDPLIAIDDARKPLRSKLLAVPTLKAKYLSYVKEIAEKSLDWKKIGPFVAAQRALIQKDVAADTRKLTRNEDFMSQTAAEIPKDRPNGLRHFFEARRKYLLENKDVAGASPLAADAIRSPESTHSGRTSGISTSAQPGPNSPKVKISELMASNTKTVRNPAGEFSDWIELHNPTPAAMDLSGCYVTDSDKTLRKWAFPMGTTIPAGGHLILWADEDSKAETGLHLNFKLSSKGEDLYVIDSDERGNAVLDHVRFEKQTDDVSFGRHPDHAEEWTPLFPTPGDRNRVSE